MASLTAACFGGPMDGQVVAGQRPVLEVAIPTRTPYRCDDDSMVLSRRTGYYRWTMFGWGDRIDGCWVYDGYPIGRIEAELHVACHLYRLFIGV